jgi:hypothetical protein
MTEEHFIRLRTIIEKELTLNEENVGLLTLKIPNLHTKYLDIYVKEMKIFKTIALDKTKLYSKLYHENKFEGVYKLDSVKEIDIYCNRDPEYYKKSQEYLLQEIIVKYLEATLDNIQKLNFVIKNYIEWRKFLAGG